VTGYTTRKAAELVGLPAHQVRAYARAGLLGQRIGPRGRYQFSFRDIVLLRTAYALHAADISARTVWKTLRTLHQKLPHDQALTSVRVVADGNRVLVKDADTLWHPDSGQFELNLTVSDVVRRETQRVRDLAHTTARDRGAGADDWYDLGIDLELVGDDEEAVAAYRHAIARQPNHADAHINLGRLLQAQGRRRAARKHYRDALESVPGHATALFNLATLLEDEDHTGDAIRTYKQAIAADPRLADAHYNLARLYERTGDRTAALRHLSRYKVLTDR